MLLLRFIRLHRHRHFCHNLLKTPNAQFSSSTSSEVQSSTTLNPLVKPRSLSERMSFIFEKIDAIEKERSQKDETLQRIRAWSESKKQSSIATESLDPYQTLAPKEDENEGVDTGVFSTKRELELSHPWPEWVELMERLIKQNYFDHRRKDEDKMLENSGFSLSEMVEEDGFDFTRDLKTVLNAVLNFGNDRFDILRSLSRHDLQILVGFGCPSADKRVVFSSKLLRKLTNLDEGAVCSSCSLRTSCEKAFLLLNKEDDARTIDVMRVLMTYAFGAINGSVVNKSLLKEKSLKNSIRKLLYEVLKLSAVPINPNLSPPIKRKPPPKVKQPTPPPRKRVGCDDIEMKKGDWLCHKCDFMNFAKNTVCLQCDSKRPNRQLLTGEWECPKCDFLNFAKNAVCLQCDSKCPKRQLLPGEWECPKCDFLNFAKNTVCLQCDSKRPKRQLLPGDWECPKCDFLNYRRNVVCFHCEHKRPHDDVMENQMQERQPYQQRSPRSIEKIPNRRADVSDAWNFDFDENESDGADVAAFEYADSRKLNQDFPPTGFHEEDKTKPGLSRLGLGFNDFDDEDDDDVGNYESDNQNNGRTVPRIDLSELEVDDDSLSANDEQSSNKWRDHRRSNSQAQLKGKRVESFSGSDSEIGFNTDDDLPNHPNWKSSHVMQFNQKNKGRGSGNMSFGSDDDFGTRKKINQKRNPRLKYSSETDDDFRSTPWKSKRDFDSEDESDNNRSRGGGQHGRGRTLTVGRDNSSRFSSNKDNFSRGRSTFSGKSFEKHDGKRRNGRDEGDFKNGRDRGRGGRSSFNRSDSFNNNNNNQSGSYLNDERYRRPRINVR